MWPLISLAALIGGFVAGRGQGQDKKNHGCCSGVERQLDQIIVLLKALTLPGQNIDLAPVLTKLDELQTEVEKMAGELQQLQADVAAEDTVIDSAITLLTGIKAALDAAIASGNPAALTALSADIQAKTQSLATAVTTNTPAAP